MKARPSKAAMTHVVHLRCIHFDYEAIVAERVEQILRFDDVEDALDLNEKKMRYFVIEDSDALKKLVN